MGRSRITKNDLRKKRFDQNYKVYKARMGFTEEDVASEFGITSRALRNRRINLLKNLDFFFHLSETWSDEEILAFVRGK